MFQRYLADCCRALKDSLTDNEGKGFIKVVVCAKSDKVLGIHLVGPEVAEILQVGIIVCLHLRRSLFAGCFQCMHLYQH